MIQTLLLQPWSIYIVYKLGIFYVFLKSVNLTSFNTALLYLEKNMYLVRGHSLNLSFAYSYKYCWFHHSLQLTVLINIHLFVLFYSGPASSRVKGPEKPIANNYVGKLEKKKKKNLTSSHLWSCLLFVHDYHCDYLWIHSCQKQYKAAHDLLYLTSSSKKAFVSDMGTGHIFQE